MQNRQLLDAQAELEASQARYADLYDFAPVAHFTLDPTGVIKEVNLAGAALVGHERNGDGDVVALRAAFIDVGQRDEALREREKALQSERALRRVLEDLDRAYMELGLTLASSQPATPAVLQVIVREARDLVDAEYTCAVSSKTCSRRR